MYLNFSNSLQAWETLNEMFIMGDPKLDPIFTSKDMYVYDLVIKIEKPELPGDFDLGRHFNYAINKWRTLVSNYINLEELLRVKDEINSLSGKKIPKSRPYNIQLDFDNSHKNGKGCLSSMIFSHRVGSTKHTLVAFLKSSEVTKRLICDLLLFQRIGEFIYGLGNFNLVIHFNQIFNDDTVLLMYQAHKNIQRMLKYETPRKKLYPKFKDILNHPDPEKITYKVYRRAAKVLRPDVYSYPRTLVCDCLLPYQDHRDNLTLK